VSDHDRNSNAVNGEAEPVVVRDRRRVNPDGEDVRASAADSDESAAGGAPADSEPALSFQEAELAAQVAERTADLQRVTAEYANYRRRVERDRESVLVGAKVSFVNDLLTVIDDIERAESHGDLNGAFKAVADKVVGVVTKLGLEPFAAPGDAFDPSVHEAVQHEESDATGPTVTVVASVFRRGYRIADRVLRPAMVTVVDRPADTAPQS
jgi:molecular chaperone GrpE